jgi:tetratricopeptide (TPR) repeat protein
LSALGHHEAVELRHELAARTPDAFQSDLAARLDNIAIRLLSNLRQHEAARAAAREAVELRYEAAVEAAREAEELRRELAARDPDMFQPDLASSLDTLANCLRDLGQREAALAATSEAQQLRSKHRATE